MGFRWLNSQAACKTSRTWITENCSYSGNVARHGWAFRSSLSSWSNWRTQLRKNYTAEEREETNCVRVNGSWKFFLSRSAVLAILSDLGKRMRTPACSRKVVASNSRKAGLKSRRNNFCVEKARRFHGGSVRQTLFHDCSFSLAAAFHE